MRTVTVASGKGGVGKTTLVANLGIALAESNHRVVLFDADLGLADLDVALGLNPQVTLQDAVDGAVSLREVMVIGPAGVRVVPGSSGVGKMIRLSKKRLEGFLTQIDDLESDTDFLLFDASAGADARVMTFLRASDAVLMVATPDPTSITDAYATIKVLSRCESDVPVWLVVNMVDGEDQAKKVFGIIQSIAGKFLKKDLIYGGYVRADAKAAQFVRQRRAFVEAAPMTPAACDVRAIAGELASRCINSRRSLASRIEAAFEQAGSEPA